MRRLMRALWIAPLALAFVSVAPLTASASGTPPTLFSMEIHPPAVVGGASVQLEPDLTEAAPTGGVVVSLSSSDPAVVPVPASVTIPAGSFLTNVTTVPTATVTAITTVEITASLPSGSVTTDLQVDPPETVTSLSLTPTTTTGTDGSVGFVTLSAAAPTSFVVTVSLTSSDPSVASVPPVAEVLDGDLGGFLITTFNVSTSTTVTITASIGTTQASAVLTVNPAPSPLPQLQGVTLSSESVEGGQSATGTVTLTIPAPAGGATVLLASSNTRAAEVPTRVVVPAGATTATFPVTTRTQQTTTTVSIGGVLVETPSSPGLTSTAILSRSALLGVIGRKGGAVLPGPPSVEPTAIFIEPFTLEPTPEGTLFTPNPRMIGVTPLETVTASVESGSLPPGLKLTKGFRLTFTIQGIPTTQGLFAFVLEFTLLTGKTFGWPYTWQITKPTPLEITEVSVPSSGTVGKAFTGGFFFGGGVQPFKWSISAGRLPPGLTINTTTSQISGTPTRAGTFTFTARLSDAVKAFITSPPVTITIASA